MSGRICSLALFFVFGVICDSCQAEDAQEIAKQAQNPIASMISVPFQNALNFGVGPEGHVQDVLDIEPVIPLHISQDWNVITRTIIPIAHQPGLAPGMGDQNGLGDINLSLYLSPARISGLIWGIGPSLTFATATDRFLGQGKFSAGPSAVALTIQGPWLVGVLVTDVTSVGGQQDRKNVGQMLVEPFVNYNLLQGWYLTSSPIVTANWKASSGDKWTIPVGGGGGKIFRIGRQAFNVYGQAFDNVDHPHQAGNWTLRVQLQLLFPTSH